MARIRIRKHPELSYFSGQCKRENAVGKCHNKKHIGYLSVKHIKQHKCLAKNCHYFEKLPHKYWEQREIIKAKKKAKKEERKKNGRGT